MHNKDEVSIPLLLKQFPTPKEFRDAIESLSPEQQRFAKAFRSMQLESTLFGVCIIQIKPQLEKVLTHQGDPAGPGPDASVHRVLDPHGPHVV